MASFDELMALFRRLMGPGGCPWDQKQTVCSIRSDLLEETHEVLEAIDLNDNEKIIEELGDVAACVAFLCCLVEKEKRGSVESVFQGIIDKLIRRHPHVFSDATIETEEELKKQWEAIKQEERQGQPKRRHHDIPQALPALSRAWRLHKALKKESAQLKKQISQEDEEMALGAALWSVLEEIEEHAMDPEVALRRYTAQIEAAANQSHKELGEHAGGPEEKGV